MHQADQRRVCKLSARMIKRLAIEQRELKDAIKAARTTKRVYKKHGLDQKPIAISAADAHMMLDLLERPARPNEALQRAFQKYKAHEVTNGTLTLADRIAEA